MNLIAFSVFIIVSLLILCIKKRQHFAFHFLIPYRKTFQGLNLLRWCAIFVAGVSGFVILLESSNIFQEHFQKNIVIAIDISHSMKNEDITPNRLDALKKQLRDDVSKMKSEQVSVILFAGKAFTQIPLTRGSKDLEDFIQSIDTKMIPARRDYEGTNIGNAILLGVKALQEERGNKDLFLYTDGDATMGFDPILAAEKAENASVRIHTIAVGREGEEYDAATLQEIAAITGGTYREVQTQEAFPSHHSNTWNMRLKFLWLHIHIIALSLWFLFEFACIPFRFNNQKT